MKKEDMLNRIKEEIIQKNICLELKQQANNLVFGSGDANAKIIFIGEAPGKNEDLSGEPFVGAAGKFLDEMLESINLNRNKVYITNIVKYRPPNNRDPLPEEKNEFLPYLRKQIEVIKPKVIVTLGRHSMNCFMPDALISKVHGQAKAMRFAIDEAKGKFLKVILMPLFHPAAALYNGSMKNTLIEDFKNLSMYTN